MGPPGLSLSEHTLKLLFSFVNEIPINKRGSLLHPGNDCRERSLERTQRQEQPTEPGRTKHTTPRVLTQYAHGWFYFVMILKHRQKQGYGARFQGNLPGASKMMSWDIMGIGNCGWDGKWWKMMVWDGKWWRDNELSKFGTASARYDCGLWLRLFWIHYCGKKNDKIR